ncbi:hypothetical protein [Cesiribacter sp. SM1]|uniref:HYC_CC_PP family protein n=1 Tax=Cesiribacter sp. SM1 TaxID=2861196 RepID=UPI001CD242C1|nr:hypothetical protein [Cesiribacter sp. SM1]
MSLIRRTILLTLSLLVLMSSIGLSVGMHLCGGAIQDLALFHAAAACPMEQKQEPLPCHKEDESSQKSAGDHQTADGDMSCCQDNLVIVDGVDNAVASKASLSFKNPDLQLIAVIQTAFLFLVPQEEAPQPIHLSYASPPIVRDIPVFVQSFLI